jgi:hypothetical protein
MRSFAPLRGRGRHRDEHPGVKRPGALASPGRCEVKTLYHYTSIERWQLIAAHGRLNTTESNLSFRRAHAGPDVVWLTTDPECRHGHGLLSTLDGTDKTRVRVAVELPNRDVHKWRQWADARGIHPIWRSRLIESSRGGASTWRLVTKPIPSRRWVEVIDRATGAVLWPPEHIAAKAGIDARSDVPCHPATSRGGTG